MPTQVENYTLPYDPVTAPSKNPYAVTPHDTNELPAIPKAIYIGTGGNITLKGCDAAAAVTFKNVPSGSILDVRVRLVLASGTTAADIVALA